MIESIFVGMSGLMGYSQGLRVIANNAANLNTPGFKSATMQFADMFYSSGGSSGQIGHGLNTSASTINFKPGELRQSGNSLDLAIDGDGMFVLKNSAGATRYTRAGQFQFNAEGVLVNRNDGAQVMGLDGQGKVGAFTLDTHRVDGAKASTAVTLRGGLSSNASSDVFINDVKVIDAAGGEHLLSLQLINLGRSDPSKTGLWTVNVLDGATTVGSGSLKFTDGKLAAGATKVNVTYTPSGQAGMPLAFDFTTDTTAYAAGEQSTLAVVKQDGHGAGALTGVSFDAQGYVVFAYANGQTVKGNRLQLGRFDSAAGVEAAGDNAFDSTDAGIWQHGVAGKGAFGAVRSGYIEISNVNLSQEFSDLVIMQRGYQASSQVVSTANEMLQQLFSMVGK